jgi:hypothetical protein
MNRPEPEPLAAIEDTKPTLIQPNHKKNHSRSDGYHPTFWTLAAIISIAINLFLVFLVIVLFSQVFTIKSTLETGLLIPLVDNINQMDSSRIQTTVNLDTNVPARFDLQLDTDTTVRLTQDTAVDNANVNINNGAFILNAPADIILPSGTNLPIHLSVLIPVDQKIPITLAVPVDIPLSQTGLHAPLVNIRDTIAPFRELLSKIPGGWEEALCGSKPSPFCSAIIP